VNQKKEAIQYPRFIKLIIDDLMKMIIIPSRMILHWMEPGSHKENPEHINDDDDEKDEEKYSTSNTSCKDVDIHSHHDDHQEDDAPHEGGEKSEKT
nr:hypothetical protein [Tanacetum cinerariifolium]